MMKAEERKMMMEREISVRENTIAQLTDLMEYFGAKSDVYDAYDAAAAEVAKIKAKTHTGWLKLVGIWEAFILFLCWIGSGSNLDLLAVANIPTAIVVLIYFKLKKRTARKLEEAKSKQDALGYELAEYHTEYGNCPLGIENTYPAIVESIYDVVRSGRANTIGEAMKVIAEEEHMRRLENEAIETRRYAEMAAKEARAAGKDARTAVRYAKKADKSARNAEFWSFVK